MSKTPDAFKTISEVAKELNVQKHVLRFWESKFAQLRPMKRGGGRRYYRPEELALLRGICRLLHSEGYTIKGVQKILREQGVEHVKQIGVERAAETKNDEAPQKRGRKGKVGAVLAVAEPPRGSVPPPPETVARKPGMPPMARDERAQIKAAIKELEVCRSILLGRAIEASAKRRRAASP